MLGHLFNYVRDIAKKLHVGKLLEKKMRPRNSRQDRRNDAVAPTFYEIDLKRILEKIIGR